MGRGIIESGLFRSERAQMEQRTTDPASTSEGEMWIRTDLAPDADQLATLRFDAGGSTWDVPIYDVAATTDNVAKAWRVPVGGATGFIPITDALPAFAALKYQHHGAAYGAHDALTASAIPDSGISRWRFDEGSGTTATDSWGTNNGTINGASYTTDAEIGTHALDFDGTDDYVDFGTPSILQDFISDNTFSVAMWVKPRDLGTLQTLFGNRDNDGLLVRVQSDGSFGAYIQVSGSADSASTSTLTADTYQHVTAVRDGSGAAGWTLYVDGSEDTTPNLDQGASGVTGDGEVLIGQQPAGANRQYDGIIDDPRVYDKSLSPTEVSNLYNTGSISG